MCAAGFLFLKSDADLWTASFQKRIRPMEDNLQINTIHSGLKELSYASITFAFYLVTNTLRPTKPLQPKMMLKFVNNNNKMLILYSDISILCVLLLYGEKKKSDVYKNILIQNIS